MVRTLVPTKNGELCPGCNITGGCACASIDDMSCERCQMHKNHCVCLSVQKVLKACRASSRYET
jgi:hypothetical protein